MSKDVQSLMIEELMEEEQENSKNELLELLGFIKNNAVPLTEHQAKAIFLLNENGLGDIGLSANSLRPSMTPVKQYHVFTNKITLADRIKGSAKLSKILKDQVPDANASVPAKDLQAQAMRERDLR